MIELRAGGPWWSKDILDHISCSNRCCEYEADEQAHIDRKAGPNLRHANLSGIQWDALTQRPSTAA